MPRRVDRVNELLRSEISYLIARQIKDPRVAGVISITEVLASNDLRSARVFVSVMAPRRQPARGSGGHSFGCFLPEKRAPGAGESASHAALDLPA